MKPLISIIIPTLNEENYIPLLLSDLEKQKEKNFEVIIVDGDSTDKTKDVAEKWNHAYPLKFINVKRKNLSYQRNYGAEKAHGEYLVFLDADARIESLFTKKLQKKILTEKGLIFLPRLSTKNSSYHEKTILNLWNISIQMSQIIESPLAVPGCLIIEKNFFKHLKGFTINSRQEKKVLFFEDNDIIIKARKTGVKPKFINDITYIFSFRRFKKEGYIKVIAKNIIALFQPSIIGDRENEIQYEMGGHLYKDMEKKQRKHYEDLSKRLEKFVKLLQKEL